MPPGSGKTDATFKGFFMLHFDGENIVTVLLELLLRGILVEEGIADLLKAPERSRREGVEPI